MFRLILMMMMMWTNNAYAPFPLLPSDYSTLLPNQMQTDTMHHILLFSRRPRSILHNTPPCLCSFLPLNHFLLFYCLFRHSGSTTIPLPHENRTSQHLLLFNNNTPHNHRLRL